MRTASGREDAPIAWVRRWADRRADTRVRADAVGNLILETRTRSRRPRVWITAHLDHPAFVAAAQRARELTYEFRGGVRDEYFVGARVEFDGVPGTVVEHDGRTGTVRLDRVRPVAPDTIGRWLFRKDRLGIRNGLLHAHACDDLAGAAAALAAFDRLRRSMPTVGVLLTRGEEMGFLGAIGACRTGTIPDDTTLVCVETSRSYPESPIGGGPVVRVGDASTVFDPELTRSFARTAAARLRTPWQRRLMPGGTCEATAFGAYGYRSTCLCLPLGNYHNMGRLDEVEQGLAAARPAPEVISLHDFDGLVRLLVAGVPNLHEEPASLAHRLDEIYAEGSWVL